MRKNSKSSADKPAESKNYRKIIITRPKASGISEAFFYYYPYNYFTAREICAYLTIRKTRKAVIKKSINVDITLPYNTHLYDKSSMCLTLSLVKIGCKISGVIRSSISHLISVHTLVAISNPIAMPKILY